jgi:hypothetical protein
MGMKSQDKRRQRYFLFSLLFSGISFRIVGDIYVSEILLSGFALRSILLGRKVFHIDGLRSVPFLISLWFLANLVSSLFSDKSFSLTLTAIATPIVTGLVLRSILEYFENNPSHVLKGLTFFAIGRLIGILVNPLPYTREFPWKFGYGDWLIILSFVLVAKFKSNRLLWFLLPILSVVSLLNEARTMTLLVVGALVVTIFNPRKRVSLAFLIILSIFPIVSYFGYLDLALSGSLGAKEIGRARLLAESDLGPLAARKEFVFSLRAFAGSPMIGYGFDPQVSREILEAGNQQLLANGVKVDYEYLYKLPMHSFLMSALVQGGILAGFFWIFALFKSLRAFSHSILLAKHERALSAYLSFSLISKILFSPFGAIERLNFAFFFSYLLLINLRQDSK